MNNLAFLQKKLNVVDRSTPRKKEDLCACVNLIYFRGTQTARATFCTSIVSISRKRSEGEIQIAWKRNLCGIASPRWNTWV